MVNPSFSTALSVGLDGHSQPPANASGICWKAPEQSSFALPPNTVHVWTFSLSCDAPQLQAFASVLSPSEMARAQRFHFRRDRNRFIAGRGQLRVLLARYLDAAPASLCFLYGAAGKPALVPAGGACAPPGFNLAHSEDLAIVVVAPTHCGVDLERIRSLPDFDALVARFFSPRENQAFQELPADEKPTAFFNLWTRKESWLKAVGAGITNGLHEVEVSFLPGEPARLLALAGDTEAASAWNLHCFEPAPGFAAALTLPNTSGPLSILYFADGPIQPLQHEFDD